MNLLSRRCFLFRSTLSETAQTEFLNPSRTINGDADKQRTALTKNRRHTRSLSYLKSHYSKRGDYFFSKNKGSDLNLSLFHGPLLTTLQQIPDTQCETPKPYCLFQSISPELAVRKSAAVGLVVLFHNFDENDTYGRRWVLWGLPVSFVVKLLCCLKDLRSAEEFNFSERIIINDLINRGLMKKMVCNGRTYYYHLNKNTAARLLKQLLEIGRK